MAKKRDQATAAIGVASEGTGRKKRKAAERSSAKIRKIADEEDHTDEGEVKNVTKGKSKAAKSKPQEEVVEPKPTKPEDMPLFAPGLRLFEGFSDTIRNTEIAALTKVEPDMEQSRKYGFTLKPLIVTEGPLAGQTILVLQQNTTFRFMDLPPEIRNMIYEYLIHEPKAVEITSHKPVGKRRRPVVSTFKAKTTNDHKGKVWDKINGKWLGGTHNTSHNLLRVCKQIQSETGSLLYGETTYSFHHWNDMELFLRTIGGMRRFVRHINIPDCRSKGYHKGCWILASYGKGTDLRSLVVKHRDVCDRTSEDRKAGITRVVKAVWPLFKLLEAKRAADNISGPRSVLDMISVDAQSQCTHCNSDANLPRLCYQCRIGVPHEKKCLGTSYGCEVKCADLEEHCKELGLKLRGALAEELKIRE